MWYIGIYLYEDLIQQVDEAKLTQDKHIETKYGLGTIRNLSSGCKTLLNIVKNPFDIPDDAKIRFNDSDIVIGGRGYNAWLKG